jgi:hypothetical protein
MRDHLIKSNLFTKLDFENSHLASEFRCYYDRANDDYLMSKVTLFHLLQKPSTEISKQIVLQENKASSFQEIFSSWPWPAQSLIKKEKAKLFHLLQIYNSSETSRQIAIQSHHESYQSADLSMMVSLKEVGQSAQISPTQLDKIKEDIYCLDSDSWFQVDQNGDIFLTNQMLLEALQQISKSRDDKFFSEHFICIAKDFVLSQSFKEYKDYVVTLNHDQLLQFNIEQQRMKCQNGLAEEMINLQVFLDKSELSDDLLQKINNYFKDNIFMTKVRNCEGSNNILNEKAELEIIKKLQILNSDLKIWDAFYDVNYQQKFKVVKFNDKEYRLCDGRVNLYQPKNSSNFEFLATYEEFSEKLDSEIKEKHIIEKLGELSRLKNASPIRINRDGQGYGTVVINTQNRQYVLDSARNKVFGRNHGAESAEEVGTYDTFLKDLESTITQTRQHSFQSTSFTSSNYAPPPIYYASNPNSAYGLASNFVSPAVQAPATAISLNPQPQPQQIASQDYQTFNTIHGTEISYPSFMLHSYRRDFQPINSYEPAYQPYFSTSALSCGVGGGAMLGSSYNQVFGQSYGGPYGAIQPQLMSSYMVPLQMSLPGTAVYNASNMGMVEGSYVVRQR